MQPEPDFIAKIYYLTVKEGGRRTPVRTGYSPQIKFNFSELQTGCKQEFINEEWVDLGGNVEALVRMLSPVHFHNKLRIGLNFEIREGARVVGVGIITEILNGDLIEAI